MHPLDGKGNGTKINGESLKRVPDGPAPVWLLPGHRLARPLGQGPHLRVRPESGQRTRPGHLEVRRPARRDSQSVRRSGHRREHGASQHWQEKGKRSRPKLATASKYLNGRTPNTIAYADFKAVFLTLLDQLDWSTVIDAADSEEILRYEERMPSPALKARLRTTETAVASHMSELSITDTKLTEAKKKHRDLLNDNIVYRTFSKAKSLEMRARFRAEIARKVARIRFWFYRDENTPKLVPDSKHDLFPFAQITFTNGRERYVAWFNNGFMILVSPEKR